MTAVWKIAPGEDAMAWPECRDFGCILVGWNYLVFELLEDFTYQVRPPLVALFSALYHEYGNY